MPDVFPYAANWPVHEDLVWPLLLSLLVAGHDLRNRRIPNYLTINGALAGLGFQYGCHGWPGLAQSLAGMSLGFGLLILFYVQGGLGAGDVKALAAVGAWLGPGLTFQLFLCMGLSGGLLALWVLGRRGAIRSTLHRGWVALLNLVLAQPPASDAPSPSAAKTKALPYGVALASGMALLFGRTVWFS